MKKFIQITIFLMLLVSTDISAQKRFMLRGRARTYPRPVMKTNVRLSWYKYQVLQKQRSRQYSFDAKSQLAQVKHKPPLVLPRLQTIKARNHYTDSFAIKIDTLPNHIQLLPAKTPVETAMAHWVVQRRLRHIRNEHNLKNQETDRIKHRKEWIHPAER